MKILFICGSLEPGKDGVGDYTRRLAAELIRQGNQVTVLAIYDRNIKGIQEDRQEQEGVFIPVLRLGANRSSRERFIKARKWLNQYNPEWLSLQYVPFSFHNKGLPWSLAKKLAKMGTGKNWHIMFHELWVGIEKDSNFKMKFWGYIQKKIIFNLNLKVKPKVVHTQSKLHQRQLENLQIDAQFLPLFSNIPRTAEISKKNPKGDLRVKNKKISFVIFGTIQNAAPFEQFAQEVFFYKNKYNVHIHLSILGRGNLNQERFMTIWKATGLDVEFLGEQPPKIVSEILQKATIGIATTAFINIEKSGSVAAMREHGLRVICVSRPWISRGMEDLKPLPFNNIVEYRPGNLKYCLENNLVSSEDFLSVSEASNQFANALEKTL